MGRAGPLGFSYSFTWHPYVFTHNWSRLDIRSSRTKCPILNIFFLISTKSKTANQNIPLNYQQNFAILLKAYSCWQRGILEGLQIMWMNKKHYIQRNNVNAKGRMLLLWHGMKTYFVVGFWRKGANPQFSYGALGKVKLRLLRFTLNSYMLNQAQKEFQTSDILRRKGQRVGPS